MVIAPSAELENIGTADVPCLKFTAGYHLMIMINILGCIGMF
jgi:hypothetical protein